MPTPSHRVVFERAANRIVGPFARIDPNDWPLSTISPSEVLWRYMSYSKFEDILIKSALYFSRPDQFEDPFEGRFSPANASKMSLSDQAFYSAYKNIAPHSAQSEGGNEVHRRCVFISCWHRNTKENRMMWDAYTRKSGAESVVITSSANALLRFLPKEIMKSPLKYHDHDFPRTKFSHNALFFYKPSEYGFEREFRLLRGLQPNESVSFDDPKDRGRYASITLRKIIHRVITHPKATRDFKLRVDGMLQKFLKHIKREDSSLVV